MLQTQGEAMCATKTRSGIQALASTFIRWIRHYSGSKIYFTLNVVQGFRTLPNLALVIVWIREEKLNSLHRLKLSDSDLSTG